MRAQRDESAAVRHAEVSLERAQATVEFDPGQVSTAALKQAIAAAGYEAG
jgi:copper chaperone CopZ